MHEFFGSSRSDALYQGTTLVGPQKAIEDLGFSLRSSFPVLTQTVKPSWTPAWYGPAGKKSLHEGHGFSVPTIP
jgi:hypothetical protein